jgi:hypothetical protein
MRRRLTILGCALAVLVVAWAVPVIALNAIQNKHEVDSMELVVENPDAYPLLEPLNWTDQKIAPSADGVDARSWTSGRVEVIERVHRYSSSISALYAFSTQDPTFVSERSARPTTAEPPSGLRADQAEIFCSDFIAKNGSHNKCDAWGAWLRYGQYTVYLAITHAVLSEADFAAITRRTDAVVNRALL